MEKRTIASSTTSNTSFRPPPPPPSSSSTSLSSSSTVFNIEATSFIPQRHRDYFNNVSIFRGILSQENEQKFDDIDELYSFTTPLPSLPPSPSLPTTIHPKATTISTPSSSTHPSTTLTFTPPPSSSSSSSSSSAPFTLPLPSNSNIQQPSWYKRITSPIEPSIRQYFHSGSRTACTRIPNVMHPFVGIHTPLPSLPYQMLLPKPATTFTDEETNLSPFVCTTPSAITSDSYLPHYQTLLEYELRTIQDSICRYDIKGQEFKEKDNLFLIPKPHTNNSSPLASSLSIDSVPVINLLETPHYLTVRLDVPGLSEGLPRVTFGTIVRFRESGIELPELQKLSLYPALELEGRILSTNINRNEITVQLPSRLVSHYCAVCLQNSLILTSKNPQDTYLPNNLSVHPAHCLLLPCAHQVLCIQHAKEKFATDMVYQSLNMSFPSAAFQKQYEDNHRCPFCGEFIQGFIDTQEGFRSILPYYLQGSSRIPSVQLQPYLTHNYFLSTPHNFFPTQIPRTTATILANLLKKSYQRWVSLLESVKFDIRFEELPITLLQQYNSLPVSLYSDIALITSPTFGGIGKPFFPNYPIMKPMVPEFVRELVNKFCTDYNVTENTLSLRDMHFIVTLHFYTNGTGSQHQHYNQYRTCLTNLSTMLSPTVLNTVPTAGAFVAKLQAAITFSQTLFPSLYDPLYSSSMYKCIAIEKLTRLLLIHYFHQQSPLINDLPLSDKTILNELLFTKIPRFHAVSTLEQNPSWLYPLKLDNALTMDKVSSFNVAASSVSIASSLSSSLSTSSASIDSFTVPTELLALQKQQMEQLKDRRNGSETNLNKDDSIDTDGNDALSMGGMLKFLAEADDDVSSKTGTGLVPSSLSLGIGTLFPSPVVTVTASSDSSTNTSSISSLSRTHRSIGSASTETQSVPPIRIDSPQYENDKLLLKRIKQVKQDIGHEHLSNQKLLFHLANGSQQLSIDDLMKEGTLTTEDLISCIFPVRTFFNERLINTQRAIVQAIVSGVHQNIPYLLLGPAGTGKSSCIMEVLIQLLLRLTIQDSTSMFIPLNNPSVSFGTGGLQSMNNSLSTLHGKVILVVAPRDEAVDLLLSSFHSKYHTVLSELNLQPAFPLDLPKKETTGAMPSSSSSSSSSSLLNILRFSSPDRIPDSIKVQIRPYSYLRNNHCALPSFEIMQRSRIVFTTTSTAYLLQKYNWITPGYFSHIIIDEASQALETELLPVLRYVNVNTRIILTGDPRQLGSSLRSRIARKYGLQISLQERLLDFQRLKMAHLPLESDQVYDPETNTFITANPDNNTSPTFSMLVQDSLRTSNRSSLERTNAHPPSTVSPTESIATLLYSRESTMELFRVLHHLATKNTSTVSNDSLSPRTNSQSDSSLSHRSSSSKRSATFDEQLSGTGTSIFPGDRYETWFQGVLTINFRSHQTLLDLPSILFYRKHPLISMASSSVTQSCNTWSLLPSKNCRFPLSLYQHRLLSTRALGGNNPTNLHRARMTPTTFPFLMVGVDGIDSLESVVLDANTRSYTNPEEVKVVQFICRSLLGESVIQTHINCPDPVLFWTPYRTDDEQDFTVDQPTTLLKGEFRSLPAKDTPRTLPITQADIAVIAPFRQQVISIRKGLRETGLHEVSVGTMQNMQGSERSIVIFCSVLSNRCGKDILLRAKKQVENQPENVPLPIGLFYDSKGLNVTLTRPQSLLIGIGNPHIWCLEPSFKTMLQWACNHYSYLGWNGCALPEEIKIQREINVYK